MATATQDNKLERISDLQAALEGLVNHPQASITITWHGVGNYQIQLQGFGENQRFWGSRFKVETQIWP